MGLTSELNDWRIPNMILSANVGGQLPAQSELQRPDLGGSIFIQTVSLHFLSAICHLAVKEKELIPLLHLESSIISSRLKATQSDVKRVRVRYFHLYVDTQQSLSTVRVP
jgi:hypothetical protein